MLKYPPKKFKTSSRKNLKKPPQKRSLKWNPKIKLRKQNKMKDCTNEKTKSNGKGLNNQRRKKECIKKSLKKS